MALPYSDSFLLIQFLRNYTYTHDGSELAGKDVCDLATLAEGWPPQGGAGRRGAASPSYPSLICTPSPMQNAALSRPLLRSHTSQQPLHHA